MTYYKIQPKNQNLNILLLLLLNLVCPYPKIIFEEERGDYKNKINLHTETNNKI